MVSDRTSGDTIYLRHPPRLQKRTFLRPVLVLRLELLRVAKPGQEAQARLQDLLRLYEGCWRSMRVSIGLTSIVLKQRRALCIIVGTAGAVDGTTPILVCQTIATALV